jgi:hypothetical protein
MDSFFKKIFLAINDLVLAYHDIMYLANVFKPRPAILKVEYVPD